MVACNGYDADEESIWGAYGIEVMNGRLLVFVFMASV